MTVLPYPVAKTDGMPRLRSNSATEADVSSPRSNGTSRAISIESKRGRTGFRWVGEEVSRAQVFRKLQGSDFPGKIPQALNYQNLEHAGKFCIGEHGMQTHSGRRMRDPNVRHVLHRQARHLPPRPAGPQTGGGARAQQTFELVNHHPGRGQLAATAIDGAEHIAGLDDGFEPAIGRVCRAFQREAPFGDATGPKT